MEIYQYSIKELKSAERRNNSIKYKNGTVFDTINYGTFKIIGKDTKPNYYLIQFDSDGQIQSTRSNQLKGKQVRNNWHIQKCKQWLVDNNKKFIILSSKYINVYTKMEFRCKICEHTWKGCWSGIVNLGYECPNCSIIRQRDTLTNLKEVLREVSPNINIVSFTYINSHTKLNLKCKICNHEWKSAGYSLKQGHGCPICANANKDGEYSLLKAERNKEKWSNKSAHVYWIKCEDKTTKEFFYKIGITISKNINYRLNMIPYQCNILNLYKTDLYSAVYLENKLLCKNREYRYTPSKKFGGWSECFTELWPFGATPNSTPDDSFDVPTGLMQLVM